MQSIVYVSRSLVGAPCCATTWEDVRARSLDRYSALDITGMLIAAPDYLLELIEGAPGSVDTAMLHALHADHHRDIRIVRREWTVERRCARWRLIRCDSPNFGGGNIAPMLASIYENAEETALRKLDRLIERLLAGDRAAPRSSIHRQD